MRLPVPAPANGHTDSSTEAVRLALDAIDADRPDGLVLPAAVLRNQVARIDAQQRACQFAEVATDLPALIRNLHITLATGADSAGPSSEWSTCCWPVGRSSWGGPCSTR